MNESAQEDVSKEEADAQEEDGLFTVSSDLADKISEEVQTGQGTQTIIYKDAASESAKVLVPQIGTDTGLLAAGRYDTRRMTNISIVDVLWLSWFDTLPLKFGGGWAGKWADSYRNHSYSVDGENKKLVVAMQQAVSGGRDRTPKKKDDRNWIQRNVTERGKVPEELYDIE